MIGIALSKGRILEEAAPLLAKMEGLPRLYLNAASLDPLLDDTVKLAEKLKAAKVPHRFDLYDGVIHGFAGNCASDSFSTTLPATAGNSATPVAFATTTGGSSRL